MSRTQAALVAVLALALLMFFPISSQTARAQRVASPLTLPAKIVFKEDPFRQHALQVQSYYAQASAVSFAQLMIVPSGKRFIVTDVVIQGGETDVYLGTAGATIHKAAMNLAANKAVQFSSGVTFEENESVEVWTANSTVDHFCVSGYFVDL